MGATGWEPVPQVVLRVPAVTGARLTGSVGNVDPSLGVAWEATYVEADRSPSTGTPDDFTVQGDGDIYVVFSTLSYATGTLEFSIENHP
jgi:hypothetical protein